jgi:predicted nicotinamide N-methyase
MVGIGTSDEKNGAYSMPEKPLAGQTQGRARDAATFIRANTRLQPVPHTPEIVLHLADEAVPLWQRTEEELEAIGLPPPFWAFAWAGGQALARHILDNAALVANARVLDLASGSGLVAIAAAKAGAAAVTANDIDAFAAAAIALNAAANAVDIAVQTRDLLAASAPVPAHDVLLVGDLFYERDTAARALAFIQRCAEAGVRVLIGDPGRSYLPKDKLVQLAEYRVPVTRELEDSEIKRTAVWTLRRP